jgi:hypothetical protein
VERPVKRLKIEDRVPVIEKELTPVIIKQPVTRNVTDFKQEGYGLEKRLRGVGEQVKQEIKTVTESSLDAIAKAKKVEAKPKLVTVIPPVIKKTKKTVTRTETGAQYSRQMWDGKVYIKDGKTVTKHHSYKHGKPVMKEMTWGELGTLNRVYRGKFEKAKPEKKPDIQDWLDYISEVKAAFDNFKNI